MSGKSTKESKKHRKSEVSEGGVQEPVSKLKAKPESESGNDVAPDTSSKQDVPKKQKRTGGQETLGEPATPAAEAQPKPKKSKKRKQTDGNETLDDQVATPAADADMQPKPKKSKKQKQTEGNETAEEPTAGADATQPKPKKSKKRGKTEGDEALDASTNPGADVDTQSKPKRSKKRKEGHKDGATPHLSPYPDPSNDESLMEQSRKALTYAYERFQALDSWKFNKARQNWLLRNFWSEKAIPEDYIPLVIKYFTDLKGGSREKLIGTCHSKSSATESSQTADDNATPVGESALTHRPSGSRAQSLLQSLLQST